MEARLAVEELLKPGKHDMPGQLTRLANFLGWGAVPKHADAVRIGILGASQVGWQSSGGCLQQCFLGGGASVLEASSRQRSHPGVVRWRVCRGARACVPRRSASANRPPALCSTHARPPGGDLCAHLARQAAPRRGRGGSRGA
jgi:hypothetical protein